VHHWTAVCHFPTAFANGVKGNQHKPFCWSWNQEAKSTAIDRWIRFLKQTKSILPVQLNWNFVTD